MNAIYVTYSLAMLLTLINLGSEVALNIITSLGTGALTCSYIVSISCIIRKRLVGEPLLPRPWSLGIWGLPINIIGVCFLILCFVMNFFPQSPKNLDATTFNWNILIVSFHSIAKAKPDCRLPQQSTILPVACDNRAGLLHCLTATCTGRACK